MKKYTILAACAAFAFPAAAGAQQDRPQGDVTLSEVQARAAERFAALDGNKDGRVTQAEITAAREARMAERQARRFDRLDANDDGAVSEAEMQAARAARQAKRAERQDGESARRGRGQRGAMRGGRGIGGGFDRLDANDDGAVTLAEYTAPMTQRFERVDADNNGTLTQAERQAARAAMRTERRQRRSGN